MTTNNLRPDTSALRALTNKELKDLVRRNTVRLEAAQDDRSRLISWIETEILAKGDHERPGPDCQSVAAVSTRKAAGLQSGGDGGEGGDNDSDRDGGDSHNAKAAAGDLTATAGKPHDKLDEISSLQLAWRKSIATDDKRNQTRARRYQHVRVGVGVIIQDPNHPTRLFAGTRRGSHGAGTLALPGGHLERFESWEECAAREVLEETGLRVEGVRFGHVTNDPMVEEDRHYVTIFVVCRCIDDGGDGVGKKQVPQNLEPEKCDGWDSYSWDDLRGMLSISSSGETRLFGPLRRLVEESPGEIVNFLAE